MEPGSSFRVHKSPPLVLTWSHMNTVYIIAPYIPKIQSSVILHLRLGLPRGFFLSVLWPKFCMNFSSLPCVLYSPHISSSFTRLH